MYVSFWSFPLRLHFSWVLLFFFPQHPVLSLVCTNLSCRAHSRVTPSFVLIPSFRSLRKTVFILNSDRPQLAARRALIVRSSASSLWPKLPRPSQLPLRVPSGAAQTPLHHHFHIIQWVQMARPRLINGHSHNPLSFLLNAGLGFKRRSSLNGPGAALSVSFVLLMWDEWGSGGDSPEIAIMHSRSRCVALLAGGGAAGGRGVCVCKLWGVPFHLRACPPYPSLLEVRVIKHLTGDICLLIWGLVFGRLLSFTTPPDPSFPSPRGLSKMCQCIHIVSGVWHEPCIDQRVQACSLKKVSSLCLCHFLIKCI